METLLIIVGAPVINAIVEYAKQKRGISGKFTLVISSMFVATVYLGLKHFLPDELEASATEFASQAGLLAVIIYEFIIKNLYPSKK